MSQDHNQGSSHFSKRPAAAGGGGSFSSQHQQAPGTSHQNPFGRAIFSKITFEASSQGIPVDPSNVQEFAIKYAKENPPRNPPKGKIFGQEHVDAAFEQFKDQYEPPQPSPQPPPQPARRITARDQLILSLVNKGIQALPKHLQQHYDMVGKMTGAGCFVFDQTPDPSLLQSCLCKETGAGVLLVFFDIHKGHDGMLNLSSFIQKRDFKKRPSQFCLMTQGSITLACVRCIGSPRPQLELPTFIDDLKVEVRGGGGDSAYNHYGQLVSRRMILGAADQENEDRLRHSTEKSDFVPNCEDDFLPSSMSRESSDGFNQICFKVMSEAGGKLLPFSSSSAATAATAATVATEVLAPSDHCGAAASCESDFIFCYHGNYVKKFGEYIPCKDCLSAPGTDTVRDGWGKVVGHRTAP